MFYGLSKFIKNLLPKRLFYRALLIVAIPVIVIQLIITIVFFDSLWIKTNKGMTRALVNEIKTFIEVYNNDNFARKYPPLKIGDSVRTYVKPHTFRKGYESSWSKEVY